jgi:hypothetical protein
MSVNTVSAKMAVPANNYVTLYTCASDKSHALVDLDLINTSNSNVTVKIAITKKPYTSVTTDDYILHNLLLSPQDNQINISGIFVGKNENIYVEADVSGVNIRLNGVEETNSYVIASGQLASAAYAPNATPYQVYQTTLATASSTSGYLNIYNPNATASNVSIYVSSNSAPANDDVVFTGSIGSGQTICLNKLLINQSEKLFIKVSDASVNVYLNGVVISS